MRLVTFLIRLSFIAFGRHLPSDPRFTAALRYVPPAILGALIAPEIFNLNGALSLAPDNPACGPPSPPCSSPGLTRSVLATIAAGWWRCGWCRRGGVSGVTLPGNRPTYRAFSGLALRGGEQLFAQGDSAADGSGGGLPGVAFQGARVMLVQCGGELAPAVCPRQPFRKTTAPGAGVKLMPHEAGWLRQADGNAMPAGEQGARLRVVEQIVVSLRHGLSCPIPVPGARECARWFAGGQQIDPQALHARQLDQWRGVRWQAGNGSETRPVACMASRNAGAAA